MASIKQTYPHFFGGISEQVVKQPGQVKDIVNAIPDLTWGLYKRPGSERIGTNPLANVQSGGSWFHYYRDETEGSYIGQVAADGKVRMWCTKIYIILQVPKLILLVMRSLYTMMQ